MRPGSVAARFLHGARWNTVAVGFTVGTNFVGNILFARILGQTEFGAYGMVQSTLLTAVALTSQFGSYAIIRYVAQLRWTQKERAGRVIGLNIIVCLALAGTIGLILAALAPFLAEHMFHAPHLVPAILVAAVVVPLMNLNAVHLGGLAAFEAFKSCARITGFGSIAYLATGAAGAVMFGVPGALLGGLVGLGLQCVLSYRTLIRTAREHGIEVQFKGSWQESGTLFRFNLPALFAGITPMGALWVGQLVLVRRAGGFDDLALYSASNTLRSSVVILPYVLYTVTSSLINSYRATGERERFKRLFWLNLYSTIAIAVSAAALCAIAAPWLLGAFGRDFVKGAPILLILLAGAVMEATVASIYQIIQARELLWQALLFIAVPRDAAIAILALLLVPLHGPQGLAGAYVGGWLLALVATVIVVYRAGIEPGERPADALPVNPIIALQE